MQDKRLEITAPRLAAFLESANDGVKSELRRALSSGRLERCYKYWFPFIELQDDASLATCIIASGAAKILSSATDGKRKGYTFGEAIKRYWSKDPQHRKEGIKRRFEKVIRCNCQEEIVRHIKPLIHMLSSDRIYLNPKSLINDVNCWNREGDSVRKRWVENAELEG